MVNSTDSSDRTAWLVVALVAALLAGGIGWAIASSTTTSWSELQRSEAIARQGASVAGYRKGVRQGTRQGRSESRLRTRYQVLAAKRNAYRNGYSAGRDQAQLERDLGYAGTGADAGLSLDGGYPESVDDLLAASSLGVDDGLGASSYADSFGSTSGLGLSNTGSYQEWYRGGTQPLLDR